MDVGELLVVHGTAVVGFLDDRADDVSVEVGKLLCRDPVLQHVTATDLMNLVTVQVRTLDLEPGHVADTTGRDIPLAGDLCGVPTVEHRIEDRLVRQTWWPSPPSGRRNKVDFSLPGGPPQGDRVGGVDGSAPCNDGYRVLA